MTTTKTLIRVPAERERRAAARMTGRYLVSIQPGAHQEVSGRLSAMGVAAATPMPHAAMVARALPSGHHLLLPHVGIAVVDPVREQEDQLHAMAAQEPAILALEPERMNHAVPEIASDYLRGWRDATNALAGHLIEEPRAKTAAAAAADLATWGLIATKVPNSRFSGSNVKLAVLDTGFDLSHPDFDKRQIISRNFVGDGQPFHDGVGHGTHCVGTAAGPLQPGTGPRYGIAYGAQLFVGRVLDDTGHGGDSNILQGIDWAVEMGCDIISLSLEAPWTPGDPPYSRAYEQAAQRALSAGCLIVAAAGNDADDPQYVGALGTPGNTPSVLSVAAIDRALATAPFSNRVEADAAGVKGPDLAGPGVDVYSAWLVGDGSYNTISGTSMATPHVAGIAALLAEQNSTVRGQALKDLVLSKCMGLPRGDVRQGEIGRGLMQAP